LEGSAALLFFLPDERAVYFQMRVTIHTTPPQKPALTASENAMPKIAPQLMLRGAVLSARLELLSALLELSSNELFSNDVFSNQDWTNPVEGVEGRITWVLDWGDSCNRL
jgi:hypothetical protein